MLTPVYIPIVPYNGTRVPSSKNSSLESECPLFKKIKKTLEKVYTVFNDVISPYITAMVSLREQISNIIDLQGPDTVKQLRTVKMFQVIEKVHQVISRTGALTAISALISLISLGLDTKKWIENIRLYVSLHDPEGGVLSSLDYLISLVEKLYTAASIADFLHLLKLVPAVPFFALIGLPLGICLTSYSMLKNGYQLFHNTLFILPLPKKVTKNNIADFEKFLSKKLEGSDEEIKKKKNLILSRRSDPKIVEIMNNLREHLKKNPEDTVVANIALKEIKGIMARKIALTSISTLMDTAVVTAMVAGLIFPVSAVAVPSLLAASALASLGSHVYKTHFWKK